MNYLVTYLSNRLDLVEPRVSTEYLPSQLFLLLVNHDRKQLVSLQSRVQEPLFHLTMPCPLFILVIQSFRLGFFNGGDKVSEFLLGSLGHPDLETDPYEKGRSGGYTVEPSFTD